MRTRIMHTLLISLSAVALVACTKSTPPAKPAVEAPAPPQESPAKSAPPAAEADEKQATEAAPKAAIAADTKVAKPAAPEAGGADADTKAKLAAVYTEIYCAQRRGESEKLLDIYTKHGFDDPETWTKTWTKAAQDGAWVAKTTHDAIRACEKVSPDTP